MFGGPFVCTWVLCTLLVGCSLVLLLLCCCVADFRLVVGGFEPIATLGVCLCLWVFRVRCFPGFRARWFGFDGWRSVGG